MLAFSQFVGLPRDPMPVTFCEERIFLIVAGGSLNNRANVRSDLPMTFVKPFAVHILFVITYEVAPISSSNSKTVSNGTRMSENLSYPAYHIRWSPTVHLPVTIAPLGETRIEDGAHHSRRASRFRDRDCSR